MTDQRGIAKAKAKIEMLKNELSKTSHKITRDRIKAKINELHNLFTTEAI